MRARDKAHTVAATPSAWQKEPLIGRCGRILEAVAIDGWPCASDPGSKGITLHRTMPVVAKKIVIRASRVSLASNLRAARALFRWSQEELGLKCGLKRTYVGALERRELNPGIDNLDKLAFGVGVLAYVLLLSPEVAYVEIYAAFELASRVPR